MIQISNSNNLIIPQNSICKRKRYSWDSRKVEELNDLCHPVTKTFDLNTLKHLRYDLIFKLYRALNPQNLSTPQNTSIRYQSVSLDITRFMKHKSIQSLKNRFHTQFGSLPTIVKKNNKTLLTCPYKAVPRAPAILPSSLLGKVISFLPGREALSAQRINSQFVEEPCAQETFKKNANELATAFVRRMITIHQDAALRHQDTVWELPDTINSLRHTRLKLDCSYLPITAEQLHKVIELFPNLKTLSLAGCILTIEHMTHLATCRQLEGLDIRDSYAQDICLRDLPLSLKKLRCSGCHGLTDAALLHLTNKQNLEELDISINSNVDTGPHIIGTHFEALPLSLKKLKCSYTALSDEALAQLANKHNLEELDISHTHIEGTHFGNLPTSLKTLRCHHCNSLQDAACSQLSNRHNLYFSWFRGDPNYVSVGQTIEDYMPFIENSF